MEYRKLPHGEEQISVIGLGGGSLPEEVDKAVEIVSTAIDAGVNFFDLAPSYQPPFYAFAKAFAGRREKVLTQMHFGAVYGNGKYGWTQDLGKIKEQIAWNFETLGTDYTDFGYLHCIDTHEDLDKSLAPGGVWEYMKSLKAEGKIRHLGFSSHEPGIARRLLETGLPRCSAPCSPHVKVQKTKWFLLNLMGPIVKANQVMDIAKILPVIQIMRTPRHYGSSQMWALKMNSLAGRRTCVMSLNITAACPAA